MRVYCVTCVLEDVSDLGAFQSVFLVEAVHNEKIYINLC